LPAFYQAPQGYRFLGQAPRLLSGTAQSADLCPLAQLLPPVVQQRVEEGRIMEGLGNGWGNNGLDQLL
jgi:hypothetical protein